MELKEYFGLLYSLACDVVFTVQISRSSTRLDLCSPTVQKIRSKVFFLPKFLTSFEIKFYPWSTLLDFGIQEGSKSFKVSKVTRFCIRNYERIVSKCCSTLSPEEILRIGKKRENWDWFRSAILPPGRKQSNNF